MSLDKVLETIGAILHPESEKPSDDTARRRGGRRDKSPIPEAGTVKRWEPPTTEGTTPASRKRSRRRKLKQVRNG